MFSTLPLLTAFDPQQHGFHFSNDKIEWEALHAGGVSGTNLCGGMIYAAMDSFLSLRSVPPDRSPPAKRTPLNSYIYRRQKTAHVNNVFLQGSVSRLAGDTALFGLFSSNSWFVNSLAAEFDKLRKQVERHFPVPLFLVKEGFLHGHHVLVIGCQSSPSIGNPILDVYDPNYEDEITSIHTEYGTKRFRLKGASGDDRGAIRGFFVDGGYTQQSPPW